MGMNLMKLAKEVARITGFDEQETLVICSMFVQVTADALESGEVVKLRHIGTFNWIDRPSQDRYDMNIGEIVTLPSGRVLRFRPAWRLRGRKG